MINMRINSLFLASLILLGGGCASEQTATTEIPSAVTNQNSSGVYGHTVWLSHSADGQNWTLDDELLIDHASVPNITRFEKAVGEFPAGTLMIVYVDASEMVNESNGTERTGRYVSFDDGKTWEDLGPVTYVGADAHVPVDPNLVQLPDGTLRMYYFDFTKMVGGRVLATSGAISTFYAADSVDGETFTVIGPVFTGQQITDPEVAYLDEQYFMFYASQSTDSSIQVATSSDGLNFTEADHQGDLDGIPGTLVEGDEIKLFGCGRGGLLRYEADSSLSFSTGTTLSGLQPGFCDPDPVVLADGSYLLVIKKIPAQNNK